VTADTAKARRRVLSAGRMSDAGQCSRNGRAKTFPRQQCLYSTAGLDPRLWRYRRLLRRHPAIYGLPAYRFRARRGGTLEFVEVTGRVHGIATLLVIESRLVVVDWEPVPATGAFGRRGEVIRLPGHRDSRTGLTNELQP
jgi:hypothetical protein